MIYLIYTYVITNENTVQEKMRPLELAQKYINIFFTTGDFDQLRQILADDLKFSGPLYSFETASDYISAMKIDPPKNFEYKMIKTYEDNSSACLLYEFEKPGISTIMTQTFEVEDDKIKRILLVFDTAAFRQEL